MTAIQPIASSFDVELIQVGREFLVRIAGQVFLAEAAELQRQFQAIMTRRSKLAVLDLTHLTFISKPGVAAIVQFAREIERGGGELILAGVQPEFRDDFLADGLEELFTLADTVEEALGDSSRALTLE
jgi:anti-anti-sigma factor